MTSNEHTVDHVLPVIGQAEFDQHFQQGIPDALPSPPTEPDIDQVPCSVARVHVPPWTTDTQDIKHSIEKQAIILFWSLARAIFRRRQAANDCPFLVRQIATYLQVSAKTSLNHVPSSLKRPSVNTP